MSGAVETLKVRLIADGKDLDATLVKGERGLEKFGDTASKSGGLVGTALGTAAGIGIAKVTELATRIPEATAALFRMATEAEETESKFRTVFGSSADIVTAFGERFGHMMGLTRTEFQGLASDTGAIVSAFGMSSDATAEFSNDVLKLAGDLQSFHNVPIEETFAALRSGLTGETEPLKRFGIIMDAAAVQAQALVEAQKRGIDASSQQAQAYARLTLMTTRANKAIGDMERTQGQTAGQMRQLAARTREVYQTFAQELAPTFGYVIDLLTGLADGSEGAATALASKLARGVFDVVAIVADMIGAISASISTLGGLVSASGSSASALSILKHVGGDVVEMFDNISRAIIKTQIGMAHLGKTVASADAWLNKLLGIDMGDPVSAAKGYAADIAELENELRRIDKRSGDMASGADEFRAAIGQMSEAIGALGEGASQALDQLANLPSKEAAKKLAASTEAADRFRESLSSLDAESSSALSGLDLSPVATEMRDAADDFQQDANRIWKAWFDARDKIAEEGLNPDDFLPPRLAVEREIADLESLLDARLARIQQRFREENLSDAAEDEGRAIEIGEIELDGLGPLAGSIQAVNAEIERLQGRLKNVTSDDERSGLTKAIRQAEQLRAEMTDTRSGAQRFADAFVDAASQIGEAFSAVTDVMGALSDRRIAAIESEREAALGQIDAEIAASENRGKVLTQEEAQREAVLARRAAVDAEYAEKERAERRKAAEAEKRNALFQIAINTAINATKAGLNPFQVAGIIALGAAQAAAVAAQPIPAYARGTDKHPGGMALVGEEGPEIVSLPRGTGVVPNPDTRALLSMAKQGITANGQQGGGATAAEVGRIVATELRAALAGLDLYVAVSDIDREQAKRVRVDERGGIDRGRR